MVRCGLDNGSCCISCMTCGTRILKYINLIKDEIESDKHDGIEYLPISKVEYFINMIEKELDDGDG